MTMWEKQILARAIEIRKKKKNGGNGAFFRDNYSQTGCSFPRNSADFRRNVGILIGSLLGAICNWRDQFATVANKL